MRVESEMSRIEGLLKTKGQALEVANTRTTAAKRV